MRLLARLGAELELRRSGSSLGDGGGREGACQEVDQPMGKVPAPGQEGTLQEAPLCYGKGTAGRRDS